VYLRSAARTDHEEDEGVTSGSVWYASVSARDGWHFVVARSFLIAVNAGASNSVLAALWALADAEELAVEDLVGVIPLTADGGVHSFALVSFGRDTAEKPLDRVVTAVVRGSAVVDLFSVGGSRRFGAGGVEPWMLADFRSVTAVVIGGDDVPTAPVADVGTGSLPVARGIVQAARLLWTLEPVEFRAIAPRSSPAEHGTLDMADAATNDNESDHVDNSHADTSRIDTSHVDTEATIITPRKIPVSPLDDETILLSRTGSRSRPASPQPVTAVSPPAVRFTFRLAPGEPQPLDAPTVFGRNPSAPRVVAGRVPRLVRVDSPDAAVSSTHLRLVAEGGAVVATDLRSTNGTLVTPRGGKRRRLRPGESLVVLAGTRIDIGDGNIIEIMSTQAQLEPAASPEPGKGPA
jgi:hypothetical protein